MDDIVNQITLNCLISKSQLLKINNSKVKKNLDSERKIKIKTYKTHLTAIFENLLNENADSLSYDDDLKQSFVRFIDKSIIHIDKQQYENTVLNCQTTNAESANNESTNNESTDDEKMKSKIYEMIDKCYDENYYEAMISECETKMIENNNQNKHNKFDDNCSEYESLDDENDEDDEY